MPLISQSSLPSSPYERIFTAPSTTISVRRSFSQTYGEDQLPASSRLVRQISAPVFASNAAMNDWVRLSFTMYSRFLWRTGEAADPYSAPLRFVPKSGSSLVNRPVHAERRNEADAAEALRTSSPSVTGVSDAKLF